MIKNLYHNMLYSFISLMGEESETEPAVEVTDPAVPAVQWDLRMMALVKANNLWILIMTQIGKISMKISTSTLKIDSGESGFSKGV